MFQVTVHTIHFNAKGNPILGSVAVKGPQMYCSTHQIFPISSAKSGSHTTYSSTGTFQWSSAELKMSCFVCILNNSSTSENMVESLAQQVSFLQHMHFKSLTLLGTCITYSNSLCLIPAQCDQNHTIPYSMKWRMLSCACEFHSPNLMLHKKKI